MVEGLAGRSLTVKCSRDGMIGRFPVIMRPSLNISRVAGEAVTRPVPKRSAGTVEIARRKRSSVIASRRLEKAPGVVRSGGTPPNVRLWMLVMFVIFVMLVTLTTLKVER
jgi:hypothetical protein